jgi:hypothetical protein
VNVNSLAARPDAPETGNSVKNRIWPWFREPGVEPDFDALSLIAGLCRI